MLLDLHAPVEVRGPYGVRRRASRLLVTLDDPDSFLARLAPRRG